MAGTRDALFPSRWARALAFAKTHKLELGLVLLGVLLRVSMRFTYDVGWSYDWSSHIQTIEWWAKNDSIPRFDYNNEAYHPPLFYWFASRFLRAGAGHQSLGLISIVAGCLRLGVVWLGLEVYLPRSRFARVVGLALLAIFPADIHLDGMVTNEGLSTLFSAIALVLAPLVLSREGTPARRYALAAGLGVALGLALLCKVSATVLIVSIGIAAALDLALAIAGGERAPSMILRRIAPLLLAMELAGAIAGWYFVRNERLYGMASPTGYDGPSRPVVAEYLKKPFLDRRSIGYVASFEPAIFADPYYPVGSVPIPRFWTQVVGSTFSDYFSAGFAGPPKEGARIARNGHAFSPAAFTASRISLAGGVVLALAVLVAWLGALRAVWRRRDTATFVLLLVPALTLLGQLTFSIRYPNDTFGPVKGSYMQFGAPPLFGLFGLAVATAWSRVRARPLAVVCLLGLGAVAVYTFGVRLPPIPDGVAYWWATRAR
jgi:hypothetical protein